MLSISVIIWFTTIPVDIDYLKKENMECFFFFFVSHSHKLQFRKKKVFEHLNEAIQNEEMSLHNYFFAKDC